MPNSHSLFLSFAFSMIEADNTLSPFEMYLKANLWFKKLALHFEFNFDRLLNLNSIGNLH